MDNLDILLSSDTEELISTLPKYQQELIYMLLEKNSNNYLETTDSWLNASVANMAKFGGHGKSKVFRRAVEAELEKFLCGDPTYKNDRAEFLKLGNNGRSFLVSSLTVLIAQTLGAAAPVLAPVVVLLLINIGKVSVRAWCGMRAEMKKEIN